jgi:hypothetical protein
MRMDKSTWTYVRSEEMLHRVKGERNILKYNKNRKANWISNILRRTWLLKHSIKGKIEGRIEVTARGLKEIGGYGKLKEGTLDCTQWRTHF